MTVTIRSARDGDGAALLAIDEATWSATVSPAPAPPPERSFFGGMPRPEDVLVAELDGRVVGYVQLSAPSRLAANRHVLQIRVSPWTRRSCGAASLAS